MSNIYRLDSSNLYNNPHDEAYIKDNTTLSTSTVINNGTVMLQPFFSSKGQDSTVVTLKTESAAINEFGYPDSSLYGQSYYQVLNWLKGGGIVQAVRLTALDAKKANIILMMKITTKKDWKTDASGAGLYSHADGTIDTIAGSDGEKVYIDTAEIEYRTESFTDIPSEVNNVKSLLKNKLTSNTTTDSNGNDITVLDVPVFAIACKGKGIYGNNYRFRITPDTNRDKATSYRNYVLELFYVDETAGLSLINNGSLNCSLDPAATNVSRQSQYIDDLFKVQGYPLNLYTVDNFYSIVSNTLLPIIQNQYPDVTTENIDILYALDKSQNLYENIKVSGIDLSLATGFNLVNGDDGNFKITDPNRDDNMKDALINFYEGKVVPAINDRREIQFSFVFDANYPLEVKVKMNEFRDKRRDFILVLDAGQLYTPASLKSFLKDDLAVAIERNFSIIVNTQNFDVYDSYCGKIMNVTTNYLYTLLLPNHIINRGNYVPFAGLNIPLSNYIIENSLRPVLSSDEEKSDIYDLRGNYIEKENGTLMFGSNVTFQSEDSELIYSNNVMVLYEMVYAVRRLSAQFRFIFTDTSDDFRTMNKLAYRSVEDFTKVKCKKVSINVEKNPKDPKNKTVKTTLKVGFKDFELNNEIEIDVDRY